jgi:hypothetical protein
MKNSTSELKEQYHKRGTLTMRPRTIRPRTMRPRTKHPLDDPSLGRSVPWTIHPLDEPSPGRSVPMTKRPHGDGQSVPDLFHKMDETSPIFWGRFIHLAFASPTLRPAQHRSPKRACTPPGPELLEPEPAGPVLPGLERGRPKAAPRRNRPARSRPALGLQPPGPKSLLN